LISSAGSREPGSDGDMGQTGAAVPADDCDGGRHEDEGPRGGTGRPADSSPAIVDAGKHLEALCLLTADRRSDGRKCSCSFMHVR
jgi:hypothetical protein